MNTKGMSSSTYVPMQIKGEPETLDAIKVRRPYNCDHCETVCPVCVHMWGWDWDIFFDRTAGGRRLKTEMLDLQHYVEVSPGPSISALRLVVKQALEAWAAFDEGKLAEVMDHLAEMTAPGPPTVVVT